MDNYFQIINQMQLKGLDLLAVNNFLILHLGLKEVQNTWAVVYWDRQNFFGSLKHTFHILNVKKKQKTLC